MKIACSEQSRPKALEGETSESDLTPVSGEKERSTDERRKTVGDWRRPATTNEEQGLFLRCKECLPDDNCGLRNQTLGKSSCKIEVTQGGTAASAVSALALTEYQVWVVYRVSTMQLNL
ncbi:hypothetical protein GQ600_26191 [Phytophthora cactorum]|nr:hypothetical protein GQ600_26191 [Phytophthora cactorum]